MKKGDIIAGKPILSIQMRRTPAGQRRKYFSFECDCGARFAAIAQTVTQAKRGAWLLCCDACRKEAKLSGQSHRKPLRAELAAQSRDLPTMLQLTEQTRGLIARLKPDVLEQVIAIVKTHLRVCLRNQVPFDGLFDRVWIEAIDLVGRGAQASDDRWTPETIHVGLQVTRYHQYTPPVGLA